MKDTAICIFACNRYVGIKNIIGDIKKNKNYKKYNYFFFIDYPKNNKHLDSKEKIIQLVNNFSQFVKLNTIVRKKNYGLNKNILSGINLVKKKYKKFIVLEDDLRISKIYLNYMQELLNKYENDKDIFSVTGYNFPKKLFKLKSKKFTCYTTKRPSSWAWGSWSKKWSKVTFKDAFYKKIYKNNKKIKIISEYGNDLKYILRDTLNKRIESWAIKWTIYHILFNKYCIYPLNTLVNEEGYKYLPTNNFFKTSKFNHRNISNINNNNKTLKLEDEDIIKNIYNVYNFPIYKKIIKSLY